VEQATVPRAACSLIEMLESSAFDFHVLSAAATLFLGAPPGQTQPSV
jgi:hypothetical protein